MIFAWVSHCPNVYLSCLGTFYVIVKSPQTFVWSSTGQCSDLLEYFPICMQMLNVGSVRIKWDQSRYIYNYWSPNVLGPVSYEWILDYVQLVDLKKNNISISAVSLRSVNFQRMLIILKLLRLRHLVLITKQSLLKIKVFESVKLNWE